LKEFTVCLSLNEENLKQALVEMLSKEFTVVDNPDQCDLFLTDQQKIRSTRSLNMLIVNVSKLPDFKEGENLEGFEHYVVYHENDFALERTRQAIVRHWLFKQKSPQQNYTGVNSLILLENHPSQEKKDASSPTNALPFMKSFQLRSSRERTKSAENLEKFIEEIQTYMGINNPHLAQYAVEIQEELLMNAIWDANPKYEKQPRTTPVDLEPSEAVTVEWGFNGKEFALSVKDHFGRLNPKVMEKYIHFIFKTNQFQKHSLSEQGVSAGLGMFMIIQRANFLSVFVEEGKCSDVGVTLRLLEKRRAKTPPPKALDIIYIKK
jgi:hypothetical protein